MSHAASKAGSRAHSHRMPRRDFLKWAAASASLAYLPRLNAEPWGQAPDDRANSLLLPSGKKAERVLELFLYGGLSPFESFYVVEEYGRPNDPDFPNQQWYLFDSQHDKIFNRCGISSGELLMPFATDALGMQVKLGPLTTPLRNRPDLLSRMRIMVQRHALEPHEAAIPYAMSGSRLGASRMAGLGSAIQHYYMDRDTTGRRIPYSYVLYPDNEISTDNLRAASAVGFHPGAARPLDLRIDSDSDFQAQLSRTVLGDKRTQYDALVAHYVAKAQERYSFNGNALRSRALTDHAFATQSLANAQELAQVIPEGSMDAIAGNQCSQSVRENTTAMGLKLAAHLLTHPTYPARYCMVVDGGLIPATGGGAFDVHSRHLPDTTRNCLNVLTELAAIINEPGENDPGKLNLDDTLILLNTEFGRTPFMQDKTLLGTNHHPYGYVTVMLGGPIGPDQAGILGAIGPDGWSDRYITPVEGRAAVLAAMGIYPFSQESFAIGDLRNLYYEKDGLVWLNEVVLGVKS